MGIIRRKRKGATTKAKSKVVVAKTRSEGEHRKIGKTTSRGRGSRQDGGNEKEGWTLMLEEIVGPEVGRKSKRRETELTGCGK